MIRPESCILQPCLQWEKIQSQDTSVAEQPPPAPLGKRCGKQHNRKPPQAPLARALHQPLGRIWPQVSGNQLERELCER